MQICEPITTESIETVVACKCRGIWSIGAVGRCLSRQVAESKPLTLECRSLVLVAAPRVSTLSHCRLSEARLSLQSVGPYLEAWNCFLARAIMKKHHIGGYP